MFLPYTIQYNKIIYNAHKVDKSNLNLCGPKYTRLCQNFSKTLAKFAGDRSNDVQD